MVGGYNHHSHLIIITIAPLVIVAGLGILGLVLHGQAIAKKRYEVSKPNDKESGLTAGKCLQASLLVLILVAPTTSTAVLRTFHCRSFDDGAEFLIADLSIECNSAKHRAVELFAGFMIIVYPIGIPLVFLALLATKRDRINPRADSELLAYSQRAADATLSPLRILFDSYRPAVWWFEVLDLVRRNLM